MPQVAVLSHHQPEWAKASTFIPKDVAALLVQRMAAEKLSACKIRMMPPDSVFLPAVQSVLPATRFVPETLPPVEIGGHRFDDPVKNAAERCRRFRLLLHARAIMRGLLRAAA